LHLEDGTMDVGLKLALGAVFASLACVATLLFTVPIPATSGYFNLGETVIYTSALLFGPFVGSITGGIGAAVADMLVAPQFALGTLVTKGCEGIIVGFLYQKLSTRIARSLAAAIASTMGGLEMVAGYFLYEQLVLSYPPLTALAEVPFNLVQMIIGLAVAVPITRLVLRFFPQLRNWSQNAAKSERT
jgi:uncharacterized membrane protein